MPSFSAADAISPAIARTKAFLFRPFRLGRFLKLTLVAALTEGGMSSCNFGSSSPSGNSGMHLPPLHLPGLHWPTMAAAAILLALVAAIAVPIALAIAYLRIRLRFSFFDCLVYEDGEIAPGWARYHRQALRYLGMTVCVAAAFWILLIPVGYQIYEHFKPLFQSLFSGNAPNLWDFLPVFATVVPLGLLLGLIGYLIHTTLGCFALPRMAVEDTSIGDALQDVLSDMVSEPGQFALFFLLRALLSLAASILAAIALLVPLVVVGLVGALIGLILKAISPVAALALGIPAAILVGILFLGAFIGASGMIGTFRRSYALVFYAGRYPALAALLWPPPAPVPASQVWQPEIPPSPSSPSSSFEGS